MLQWQKDRLELCGEFSFFTNFFGDKTSRFFINFFTKKIGEESFEFLSYIQSEKYGEQ